MSRPMRALTLWGPIPGYEGYYEASTDGQVRSVDRLTPGRNRNGSYQYMVRGRTLSPVADEDGYLRVCLRRRVAGRIEQRSWFVHHLVLLAFAGARMNGTQCRHLDGNPANNRVENLAWGNAVENAADKVRHGTALRGAKHPMAKLSRTDVLTIRSEHASGVTGKDLARRYGVAWQTIHRIVHRKTWRHV